jgi:broad specificity phosphatase PhoE
MPRIILIRHGKAAAGFSEHLDPGLDATGHAQAEAMAAELSPIGPLPLVTSPLRRTRETAAALERAWSTRARIEPRFAELPSPGLDLAERGKWLKGLMAGRWPDTDPALHAWRRDLFDAILGLTEDSVVVTHYIPINTIVGAAAGDDRLIVFRPDHCSRTIVDIDGGRLRAAIWGAEAATQVM